MKQEDKNILFALLAGFLFLSMKKKPAIHFIVPVHGTISSYYGERINPLTGKKDFHNGLDILAATGTTINAPADGQVAKIYSNTLGGLQMIIKHADGLFTGYAHLSMTLVKATDMVKQGQPIAKVGTSGESTGPHLHFTVFNKDGQYLNPKDFYI